MHEASAVHVPQAKCFVHFVLFLPSQAEHRGPRRWRTAELSETSISSSGALFTECRGTTASHDCSAMRALCLRRNCSDSESRRGAIATAPLTQSCEDGR